MSSNFSKVVNTLIEIALNEYKSGGAIVEVSGKVKKISATDGTIVLTDGCKIRDIAVLSINICN